MKKELIENVVDAAVRAGFIDLTDCSISTQERFDEVVVIIEEQVRIIEEERRVKCIKNALDVMRETIECEIKSVEENGTARKATLEDHLELIRNEWEHTKEYLLEECGINLYTD